MEPTVFYPQAQLSHGRWREIRSLPNTLRAARSLPDILFICRRFPPPRQPLTPPGLPPTPFFIKRRRFVDVNSRREPIHLSETSELNCVVFMVEKGFHHQWSCFILSVLLGLRGLSASLEGTNDCFFLPKINTTWLTFWLLNIFFYAGFLKQSSGGLKWFSSWSTHKTENINTIHIIPHLNFCNISSNGQLR